MAICTVFYQTYCPIVPFRYTFAQGLKFELNVFSNNSSPFRITLYSKLVFAPQAAQSTCCIVPAGRVGSSWITSGGGGDTPHTFGSVIVATLPSLVPYISTTKCNFLGSLVSCTRICPGVSLRKRKSLDGEYTVASIPGLLFC